jgi:glucose/arabinose dehydrogenase
MKKIALLLLITLLIEGCYFMRSSDGGGETGWSPPRKINPDDIALLEGYTIEKVAGDFTFPTGITFDAEGNLYVIEAGYSYGEVFLTPKLYRVEKDGKKKVIAEGENNGPWTNIDFYNGNFYVSEGGQMEGGKILRISPGGEITSLLNGLPGNGDHHTNAATIYDGYIYFSQGVVTNSSVVGADNYKFGWLKRFPSLHDIPCKDVELTGENFESENPFEPGRKAVTGSFVPFNQQVQKGEIIKGRLPCSGAIMRMPVNGGDVELYAWGFRNPFGLAFDQEGNLYATDNGYDDRGSRPVWGTGDLLWKVEKDIWYGWPDFSGNRKLHNVKPVMAQYPNQPPEPSAYFGVHSSSNGITFSKNDNFGFTGNAFIAQFGDQAPGVGKVLNPVGFKVVRVDVERKTVHDFAVNKGKTNGPASWIGHGGLERPVSLKFNPAGDELYLVDFGVLLMSEKGANPQKETGVIWRIKKGS